MSNNTMTRVFGGSPMAVLGRLILVSILVGVVLAALGLDPYDIVHSVERLIRSIWNMGFDAFRWLWRYFLLGAVIVIPIWILMRVVNAPRENNSLCPGRSAARSDALQTRDLPIFGIWNGPGSAVHRVRDRVYVGQLSAVISAASVPTMEASESRWPRLSAANRSALISDTTPMPR